MAPPTKGPRSRTPGGPDLFEFAAAHAATATIDRPRVEQRSKSAPPPPTKRPTRRPPTVRTEDAASIVAIDDMPNYPPDLHRSVEQSLADLPGDQVWFTYRSIKRSFGVSRATIARRVKDGLVPGVRISNGRVLDDGSVRRFDRTQLKWLLLAVRFARWSNAK